jgi:hypothetical protein
MESRKALRKAVEEIRKPLPKAEGVEENGNFGVSFSHQFATTRAHGFTLMISSTHNLK